MASYQTFSLHCATALTWMPESHAWFDALLGPNRDFYVVKSTATESGYVEVHALAAEGTYQTFSQHWQTPLPQNIGSAGSASFALAPNGDLFTVLTETTGSGFVEVHVLSADLEYKVFSLQTSTPLGLGSPLSIMVAPNRDLYAVKTSRFPGRKVGVELAILSAASQYKSPVLQTLTAFELEEGDIPHYALASNLDLFMLKEHKRSTNAATEVHVLSQSSGYQAYRLQTSTPLRESGDFQFLLAEDRSLFAVKMRETPLQKVELHVLTDTITTANWLEMVDISTPLSDINLPGTHDSAAINTWIATFYSCQNKTITEQLEFGIRVLDIRLKAKPHDNTYDIVTCHGDIGGGDRSYNEYQSFKSVLEECKYFLIQHGTETIVMSLKFDDWDETAKAAILDVLKTTLAGFPTLASKDLPTLGAARGKIVLLNQFDGDPTVYGAPISWSGNTSGQLVAATSKRSYPVYVQDHYKDVDAAQKLAQVWNAALEKQDNRVVLNFVSAVQGGIPLAGLYIDRELLGKFGTFRAAERPAKFGWMLCDFPFRGRSTDKYGIVTIADFIIASNFGYFGYQETFSMLEPPPMDR